MWIAAAFDTNDNFSTYGCASSHRIHYTGKTAYIFLGGALTSICHFVGLSVLPSTKTRVPFIPNVTKTVVCVPPIKCPNWTGVSVPPLNIKVKITDIYIYINSVQYKYSRTQKLKITSGSLGPIFCWDLCKGYFACLLLVLNSTLDFFQQFFSLFYIFPKNVCYF